MKISSLENILITKHLIPWGKSWLIRMGILDLLHDNNQIFRFSKKEKAEFPSDAKSLIRALTAWNKGDKKVDVGESGTLLRCLLFISSATLDGRKFVRHGSLLERKITDDPMVAYISPEKLGKLDGGTSQWQTASYLFYSRFGKEKKIENPPEMLKLTYEAVDHWRERQKAGKCWELQYDKTIIKQALAIIEVLQDGDTLWRPQHSEDYCLARALGKISVKKGEKRFPSAAGHETNRFEEIEKTLAEVENGGEITSSDHRVIQAGTVRQLIQGLPIKAKYPSKVAKSWPQYWRFMNFLRSDILGATK